MSEFIILISLGYRAFTELHHWMSCCWSSSNFQLQGTDRLSSMLTASTIPFCSFFPWNWRSGLPRTCLMSWICQTPAMSGAQQTWTIFLFTAWFQTDGAITCTPFNASSLNPICIEGLCGRSVFLSIWKSIASMARMLRCVDIQSIFTLFIIIYHIYETIILGIYQSWYQNIPFIYFL